MKRWLALALSVITFLLAACILPASAEEETVDDWSVYIMEETSSGVPVFKDPPTYSYTKRGLRVTPTKDMTRYTIQLDTPQPLSEDFFLELEVEDVTLENTLMFHLWNQSGVLIGNHNCGSGWYSMISVNSDGSDYMMSLNVEANSPSAKGWTEILGSMKVSTDVYRRVGRYTLSMKDGILRLNGSAVPGLDEALKHLKERCPDGMVYIGVSIVSFNEGVPTAPITVTRFGKDETTAPIPGSTAVPDITPTETVSDETASGETGTGDPAEETTAPEAPSDESEPHETVTVPTVPMPEPESETVNTFEQLKDIYGQASARCHSTLGLSGLGYVAAVTLGALLLRKKKD